MGAAPAADEVVHPRTQINVPNRPKERHQEQTHTKQGAEHPVTVAGSSKAEHRTRVVETKALKTPEKAKSMQHHASVKDRSLHSPRHITGTEKGTPIPSHQRLEPSTPELEHAAKDEIRPKQSTVEPPPTPPPLEHFPDDAFRKDHATKVPSSP